MDLSQVNVNSVEIFAFESTLVTDIYKYLELFQVLNNNNILIHTGHCLFLPVLLLLLLLFPLLTCFFLTTLTESRI